MVRSRALHMAMASSLLIGGGVLASTPMPPIATATHALTSASFSVDLPSAVASRVKRINNALDAVETALEADRLTTAQRKLTEANRYLKEILDRYDGKFDAEDPEYKAMMDRLSALTTKVTGVEQEANEAEAASKEAMAAHEALCKEWAEKLRPFIDYKSDSYLRIAAEFNRASEEEQAQSKAAYPKAKALFDEYSKVKFRFDKTMDLKNVESRLESSLKYYDREAAGEAQAAACKEWEDRLAPFVDPGMISAKRLIASATADPQQMREQQAIFEEATLVFKAYQAADFPLGKTFRLERLEELMANELEEFPAAMAESHAMMSGDIGKRIDNLLGFMNRDTAWKTDLTLKPPVIMERDLEPMHKSVDEYAGTVSADDAKLLELQRKLQSLDELNAEHAAIRAKRTYQRPDGYAGTEIDELKAKSKSIATAAYPKGDIMRVTVPSADWVIEDVIEWTDSTKTAWRRRLTRSVRAEVAVKDENGAVWLQEIYLGQDRTPDGAWSALKGHTTWADRMAAENVGKEAPKSEDG